ncbi:MAG: hypothetical protein EA367_07340 [Leptolyngbya sp. DLM2.Bin15]|nr:MAG: hypothetical protein EA367_07340 [Leptolyngbya sp. DLM2.Bin15]
MHGAHPNPVSIMGRFGADFRAPLRFPRSKHLERYAANITSETIKIHLIGGGRGGDRSLAWPWQHESNRQRTLHNGYPS